MKTAPERSEWAFALALFTRERGIEVATVWNYLKPHLFTGMKKNRSYLHANRTLMGG